MFSIQLERLDQLEGQFGEVVTTLHELERQVASVPLVPNDAASVDAAIERIDQEVDRRLLPYEANEIVAGIAAEFKAKAAENIRLRAQRARAAG